MSELTYLSLLGVLLYALAFALCLAAARSVRAHGRGDEHFANWLVIAGFFLALMVLRGFSIEDWTQASLRRALKTGQIYQERRELQAAIAAGLATLFVIGTGFAARVAILRIRDRCDVVMLVANAASLAMLALVGLRWLSYHTIDAVLYGLRLNWIIDIGATLTVGISAIVYLRLARRHKVSKRRPANPDPIAKRVMAANRSKRRSER